MSSAGSRKLNELLPAPTPRHLLTLLARHCASPQLADAAAAVTLATVKQGELEALAEPARARRSIDTAATQSHECAVPPTQRPGSSLLRAGAMPALALVVLAPGCSSTPPADGETPPQRGGYRVPAMPGFSGGSLAAVGGEESRPTAGRPGLGGAGGSPSDAPAPKLIDDNATTARGVAVALDVLANDGPLPPSFVVTAASSPKHGLAEALPEPGRIRYSPEAGFVGVDSFEYAVADRNADEAPLRAKVKIEIVDQDWLVVGSAAYELALVSAPALDVAQPVRFFDAHRELASLQIGTVGLEQAFTFDVTAEALTPLAFTPARAHHFASDGVLAGSRAADAGLAGVLWLQGRTVEVAYPGATSTELFGVNEAGVAVGWAAGGVVPSGETLPFQYRIHNGQFEPIVLPEGRMSGSAMGIDGAGNVVGSASFDGTERAYIRTNHEARWLPLADSVWSRACDVRSSGEVVGMARMTGRLPVGFVAAPGGEVGWVEHSSGVSTWLLGVGESGELTGSFVDPRGRTRPFLARPLAANIRTDRAFSRATESANAGVAHACIHSVEGPFRVLAATSTADSAPTFETPHTSYTVLLTGGDESQISYRALEPGPFSFFIHPPAALRVYAADDSELLPALVRRTGLCPKMSWAYQFQAPVAGDYRVVIGPRPLEKVAIILERSWAFEE